MSTTPEQLEADGRRTGVRRGRGDASRPMRQLVLEDLLVEDVSIDGMCGVY